MPPSSITLENGVLQALFRMDDQGLVYLDGIIFLSSTSNTPRQASPLFEHSSLPIVGVRLQGQGNGMEGKTSKSLTGSVHTSRFIYHSHRLHRPASTLFQTLDIELHDSKLGIIITSHWVLYDSLPVLRSSASITNDSSSPIDVTQLSSLVIGGLTTGPKWWETYRLSLSTNSWFREAQWTDHSLPSLGIDDYGVHDIPTGEKIVSSLGTYSVSNRSTFSTQGHLPMGLLERNDGKEAWLWQVENNGAWRWEVGDHKDSVYLATSGPNAQDHEWVYTLSPGGSYTTCPTALVHVSGDRGAAFAALTAYRRLIIRPHPDHSSLPIIFNDYMNCLMGDPTESKILALVPPVAASGAEYFVIDAGWYAEDRGWWDDVGAWEPSNWRFPKGFAWLVEEIRRNGLKTGLWLEPEVIGVRSRIANELPPEAFFQRNGVRIVERGRYQLDYRHPAVVKRMDAVIDRLVKTNGIEYFKFDYNIEVTLGTDTGGSSPGSGQEGHARAYVAWLKGLLDRYPSLVIENCSSGAQRMEYDLLSVLTLQSTSDQQDPVRYAAIAAAAATAVLPEQGAVWAYPQPKWSDEINALTIVNSLLGRIHLSGRLDLMSPSQLELVREGMKAYEAVGNGLRGAVPFWPLGLPGWHDEWLALGMASSEGGEGGIRECYMSVWRRGGSTTMSIPVPPLKGKGKVTARVVYPTTLPAQVGWIEASGVMEVEFPETICARLCHLVVE